MDSLLVVAEALLSGRMAVAAQTRAANHEARRVKLAMERLAKRKKTCRPMPPSKFPARKA